MELHNLHNNYFQRVMSNVNIARDFLKVFLKDEILDELDLDTLKIKTSSFIDEELKEKYADLVYQCELKDKNAKDLLRYPSILFEHKSSIDSSQLPLQLLSYLSTGYNLLKRQKNQLGTIIPIVFYHGKKKPTKKTIIDIVHAPNVHFSKYLPNFDYDLVDANTLSNEQREKLNDIGIVRDMLMLLRSIWDPEELLQNLTIILGSYTMYYDTPEGANFLQDSFVYIIKRFSEPKEVITSIVEKLPEPLKNSAMSTYDMIKLEGKKEERLLIVRKLLKKGVQDSFISETLEVSLKYIKNIKEKMKKNGEL